MGKSKRFKRRFNGKHRRFGKKIVASAKESRLTSHASVLLNKSGTFMPDKYYTKLTYASTANVASTVGGAGRWCFRANSLYDVEYDNLGVNSQYF